MAVYIHSSGKVTFFGNKLFGVQPQEGMELVEHTDSDDPVAQLAQSVQPGKLGIDETWPSRFLIGLMAHRPTYSRSWVRCRSNRLPCTRMKRSAS